MTIPLVRDGMRVAPRSDIEGTVTTSARPNIPAEKNVGSGRTRCRVLCQWRAGADAKLAFVGFFDLTFGYVRHP